MPGARVFLPARAKQRPLTRTSSATSPRGTLLELILGVLETQESAHLPVQSARIRELICEKVDSNPVTLIAGRTGSGKSSQVPQMLLEALGGPVLVSQPRRVAAVSLARRVASERGCELGDEVGRLGALRNHEFADPAVPLAFTVAM